MKYILVVCLLCFCSSGVKAQKSPLKFEDLELSRPTPMFAKITNDGRYIVYDDDIGSCYVKYIDGSLLMRLPGVTTYSAQLSSDSRYLIAANNDKLYIVNLPHKKIDSVGGVGDFKLCNNERGDWLAYLGKHNRRLTLYSLSSQTQASYDSVSRYEFNSNGTALALVCKTPSGDEVRWVDLPSLSDTPITNNIGSVKKNCI